MEPESIKFSQDHSVALWMRHISAENYIGARKMFQLKPFMAKNAMVLAEQACEKLLKCLLLMQGLDISKLRQRKIAHNPFELLKLCNDWKGTCLSNHNEIAKKLAESFNRLRYPDYNIKKAGYSPSFGVSTKDLKDIDEFYLCIEDQLALPDDIRYRGFLYSSLFQSDTSKILLDNNNILKGRYSDIKEKYESIFSKED